MRLGGPLRAALGKIGDIALLLEEQGGEAAFVASLQPVLAPAPREDGPLGVGRRQKAKLYAPWDEITARLAAESRIVSGGVRYRVLQTETVRLGKRPLYIWAVVEREEEAK